MNEYSYLNEFLLNMYVAAVESNRFSAEFVPFLYRQAVADILQIELND